MKIVAQRMLNTGGNCMVYEVLIENGGKLKSIGINDECVVGYDCEFFEIEDETSELWVARYKNELYDHLPTDIADKVLQGFEYYYDRFKLDRGFYYKDFMNIHSTMFVAQLPHALQREIRSKLEKLDELSNEDIENAMDSRLCDIEETIEWSDY